jgi:exodeoxyribonuclease VII small subunit
MKDKDKQLPDFEKSLEELEDLVEQLESGELNLDQSLNQFKRGVELTRHCQAVLQKAQQTVEKLVDLDDESSAAPFADDD